MAEDVLTPSGSTTAVIRTEDGARIQFRRLVLVVESGPDEGGEYDLDAGETVVGRGEGVDVQLADSSVSREHCKLVVDSEGVRVVDLGSRSGTRANGVVVPEAKVAPGTRLEIGASVLKLVAVETELSVGRYELDEFEGLLGGCTPMRELFGLAEKIAPLSLPVLLRGETGTGKEGLAHTLHVRGARASGPFVVVDCTLLDDPTHARSELFGHEPGAFTGASDKRLGAFQRAHEGTLFLDEIGELPLEIQAQLLRVLQEGEVRPLGGGDPTRVDVRLVSATHRDLDALAVDGKFRRDLFFRLAGITLEVPPLRDREKDALLLARHFLPEGASLAPDAERALLAHPWPGNVRELQFVIERAAALSQGGRIGVEDLRLEAAAASVAPLPSREPARVPAPGGSREPPPSSRKRVAQLEAADIVRALEETGGNRKEAARVLGVSRATLYRKLSEFGLDD